MNNKAIVEGYDVEGYNGNKVTVEYEFIELDNVTREEFCCLSIEEYDHLDDITHIAVAGLSLDSVIELRNGLNKLIDNYVLNKEVIINKGIGD